MFFFATSREFLKKDSHLSCMNLHETRVITPAFAYEMERRRKKHG
jgi:hypothetical protein